MGSYRGRRSAEGAREEPRHPEKRGSQPWRAGNFHRLTLPNPHRRHNLGLAQLWRRARFRKKTADYRMANKRQIMETTSPHLFRRCSPTKWSRLNARILAAGLALA